MTITNTTDAAALPAFITTPAPKRKRRAFKRVPIVGEPTITRLSDGALSVSLFGRRAIGRSMELDAGTWAMVAQMNTRWVLNTNGRGRDYVRSGQRKPAAVAGQPGETPLASLARVIASARRGEVVSFQDGNPLNLRQSNLALANGRGRPIVGRKPHGLRIV